MDCDRIRRRLGLAAALLATTTLVAPAAAAQSRGADRVEQVRSSPREDVPSALDDPDDDRLPKPRIKTRELISGGPPPDGIPAIDDPRFERVPSVDWLDRAEPVLAFSLEGEARAYPIRIMIWHEIVNDTVGGVPVAITYCPLCNSAIAFDRRVGERVLDFGTSGLLYRSDLVMYDRQTESLWPQFEGRAVAGFLTGTTLERFSVATVSWKEFRQAHPEGLVLALDTGFNRQYGVNPYGGYDDARSRPFLFTGEADDRLPPMTRVVGIDDGDRGLAIRWKRLQKRMVVAAESVAGPITLWWKGGTASALDDPLIRNGRDVGSVQAFVATVDGQVLTFAANADGTFRDEQTGSTWDFFGRAVAGPFAGRALQPALKLDTFWFSWAAFNPDTRLR